MTPSNSYGEDTDDSDPQAELYKDDEENYKDGGKNYKSRGELLNMIETRDQKSRRWNYS
jgi:hypothetical protein